MVIRTSRYSLLCVQLQPYKVRLHFHHLQAPISLPAAVRHRRQEDFATDVFPLLYRLSPCRCLLQLLRCPGRNPSQPEASRVPGCAAAERTLRAPGQRSAHPCRQVQLRAFDLQPRGQHNAVPFHTNALEHRWRAGPSQRQALRGAARSSTRTRQGPSSLHGPSPQSSRHQPANAPVSDPVLRGHPPSPSRGTQRTLRWPAPMQVVPAAVPQHGAPLAPVRAAPAPAVPGMPGR